jgi:hypothetical protein
MSADKENGNGKKPGNGESAKPPAGNKPKPRVISNPNDVAGLVMMQIDAVSTRKDELTIAIKGLTDTTKQLVRAYAQQTAVIQKLSKRVKELEDKTKN